VADQTANRIRNRNLDLILEFGSSNAESRRGREIYFLTDELQKFVLNILQII